MLSKIKRYYCNTGLISCFLLLFFPLVLLFTNSTRLAITLKNSLVLANGKWSSYNRFRPDSGINSLFYWTQALNFDRFGRNGISPYVGTGNFHLGHWWFNSLTSIYLYWRLGSMFTIICMFGWYLSHLIYINHVSDLYWFFFILLFTLLSSYFFAATFVTQNYNIFGWLFVPFGLFSMLNENYLISCLFWFLVSLGSITVIFITFWLNFTLFLLTENIFFLAILLPAFLKLSTHFFYSRNLKDSLLRVIKGIGVNKSRNNAVKYKRKKASQLYSLSSLYFIFTWSVFAFILFDQSYFMYGYLILTIILLWIVNTSISRFADPQSLYMAVFSVSTLIIIMSPSILLLIVYWICISPPPYLIGAGSHTKNILKPRSLKPFKIGDLIDKGQNFLKNVPKNSRVLLALKDPSDDYSKIFDGYRTIYELLFYAGNKNKTLIFPDWWAIFENNNVHSKGFWGIEPEQVKKNLKLWNANYTVVYQNSETELEKKWRAAGFFEVSSLDWHPILINELDGESCWGNQRIPKWFLLKKP